MTVINALKAVKEQDYPKLIREVSKWDRNELNNLKTWALESLSMRYNKFSFEDFSLEFPDDFPGLLLNMLSSVEMANPVLAAKAVLGTFIGD